MRLFQRKIVGGYRVRWALSIAILAAAAALSWWLADRADRQMCEGLTPQGWATARPHGWTSHRADREARTLPDHEEIYRRRAAEYEELVTREDFEGKLLPALEKIVPFRGRDVVDFGAGTGRVTCLLAPLAKSIRAYDLSSAMLELAVDRLRASGLSNWSVAAADSRRVPAETASADVAIAGWSLCYIATASPDAELDRALAEMERVLRPGGTVILIETLGTGFTTPHPPDHLAAYFAFLDKEGFQRIWIRTDYRFRDRAEGERLARFFFGDEMAAKIVEDGHGVLLPECTGLWWRHGRDTRVTPRE